MYLDISKYNFENFRQKQLNEAIFKSLVGSFDEMTTLPKNIKNILKKEYSFPSIKIFEEIRREEVVKKIFQTKDRKFFESVLLLHEKNRSTVCVSSQIGCPLGCKFCATGNLGFERDLNFREIVDQILDYARLLNDKGKRVTNIVYMGMGEPFLNMENLNKSVDILLNPEEFNISPRRITISTVWPNDKVLDFFKKYNQVNLAVSLHSVYQKKREELMPIGRNINIEKIEKGLKKYFDFSNRRVTLEYLLLEGINDSFKDLDNLINFIDRINRKLLHVNLLPYNEINNDYIATKAKDISKVKNYLQEKGINVTVRKSLGQDIDSACGMLKSKRY